MNSVQANLTSRQTKDLPPAPAKKETAAVRHADAFNFNLRTIGLVDLASMVGTDAFECSLDGATEDLMDFLLDKSYKLHPSMASLRKAAVDAEAESDSLDMLGELLQHRALLGLAVHFSTPVMTKMGARHWSFSWGYTTSTWVYADSYDEAWRLGVAWAERCKAEAKSPKKKTLRADSRTQTPKATPK